MRGPVQSLLKSAQELVSAAETINTLIGEDKSRYDIWLQDADLLYDKTERTKQAIKTMLTRREEKTPTDLFRSVAHNSIEMTSRTLKTLHAAFGVSHIGDVAGSAIVSLPYFAKHKHEDDGIHWNSHEWFTLTDNGTEINVEPINHVERMRSIPSSSNRAILTAETMAWRLWCAMSNQEIDWDWNDGINTFDVEPLKIIQGY
jgi:hypothetical protein